MLTVTTKKIRLAVNDLSPNTVYQSVQELPSDEDTLRYYFAEKIEARFLRDATFQDIVPVTAMPNNMKALDPQFRADFPYVVRYTHSKMVPGNPLHLVVLGYASDVLDYSPTRDARIFSGIETSTTTSNGVWVLLDHYLKPGNEVSMSQMVKYASRKQDWANQKSVTFRARDPVGNDPAILLRINHVFEQIMGAMVAKEDATYLMNFLKDQVQRVFGLNCATDDKGIYVQAFFTPLGVTVCVGFAKPGTKMMDMSIGAPSPFFNIFIEPYSGLYI